MFKVNNRNLRASCEICLKFTKKTLELRLWRCSGVFIVKFEHISQVNTGWVSFSKAFKNDVFWCSIFWYSIYSFEDKISCCWVLRTSIILSTTNYMVFFTSITNYLLPGFCLIHYILSAELVFSCFKAHVFLKLLCFTCKVYDICSHFSSLIQKLKQT